MKTKLYSETVGLPVVSEADGYPLAIVKDVLVDYETGKIAAFLLPRHHVVLPVDMLHWDDLIAVSDESQILEMNEVVRVRDLSHKNVKIFGKKVVTETGLYIGRVYDICFDVLESCLLQIYVAKFFLFFRFETKIIPFASIVEVRKDKVIVKDLLGKERDNVPETTLSPA